MVDNAERKIMDMIQAGQITAEEGLRLLNAMGGGLQANSKDNGEEIENAETAQLAESDLVFGEQKTHPQIPQEEMDRMKRLKRWWILPFGIGLLITTLGAIWMYSAYEANGFGFGFWLAWLPFLAGIFILAMSFQSSRSVWVHLRIQQKPGETPQKIAISLPMPISLTRWALSNFGHKIPGLRDQPVDQYSEILDGLSPEEPFYIHVDDDDGESVEIFIG